MPHSGRPAYVATLLTLVMSLVLPVPSSIAGAPRCVHDASIHRVTVTADDQANSFQIRRKGNSIEVRHNLRGFDSCDGATVNNTDRVHFVDETTDGEANLVIRTASRFTPGWTHENAGRSEIEFNVDTGTLTIRGSVQDDTFIGGTRGLNVNGDHDVDIRLRGPEVYTVLAQHGDDSVFMDGRRGAGKFDVSDLSPTVYGRDGDDLLVGSAGPDFMDGGRGNDRMWGRSGRDRLYGDWHNDHIIGGEDEDNLHGGSGSDHVEGSSENDRLRGENGRDHLDGDTGVDDCDGEAGKDTYEDCESRESLALRPRS